MAARLWQGVLNWAMIPVRCNVAGCASPDSALQTCKAGAVRGAPQIGRSNTAVERT
jgi:hypothetical protein